MELGRNRDQLKFTNALTINFLRIFFYCFYLFQFFSLSFFTGGFPLNFALQTRFISPKSKSLQSFSTNVKTGFTSLGYQRVRAFLPEIPMETLRACISPAVVGKCHTCRRRKIVRRRAAINERNVPTHAQKWSRSRQNLNLHSYEQEELKKDLSSDCCSWLGQSGNTSL